MSLDRQAIEKRDFPISRRGYETLAVDAHLAQVAREVEALRAAEAAVVPPPVAPDVPSLASSASEQVRSIVQAAERSAAEIEQQAKDQAQAARSDADADARATRETASTDAQEHVTKVHEATAAMLERIAALGAEVGGLLEHVRTEATGLQAHLTALHAEVAKVRGSEAAEVESTSPAEAAPAATSVVAATSVDATSTPASDANAASTTPAIPVTPVAPPAVTPAVTSAPAAPDPDVTRSSDEAGARMVALNLMLDGTPREEVERHLDEHYELADRGALLDDIYARQA